MPDPQDYPGVPRWVKVTGAIGLVVILLIILLVITRGSGGHGPGRHMSLSGAVALVPAVTPD